MSLLQICALAFVSATAVILLKNIKDEFTLPIKLIGGVLILSAVIGMAAPLLEFAGRVAESYGASEWSPLLLKALAIALLTEISASICRECGEGALASGVELCGKVEIMLLSLPLISKILEMSKEILMM